ncbi:MAG: pyrimidine/purine nucleoside phosphorylase [Bacteroidales bacterium]|nr:pyrimidine/purine nucleoside phosphorylase [Bacteroidales bacterium]
MFTVNQYFDGKVVSLGHEGADGKATVGVIAPGEYEFGTSTVEIMTVISGKMNVKQPADSDWKEYKKFESFRVEKGISFKVSVDQDTPYQCLYL